MVQVYSFPEQDFLTSLTRSPHPAPFFAMLGYVMNRCTTIKPQPVILLVLPNHHIRRLSTSAASYKAAVV